MDETLVNYVRANRIDSFQKLRFILLLYRNPHMKGTSQDFAERLHLGDTSLVDKIITDLEAAGVVDWIDNHCSLKDKPETRRALRDLDQVFDNPRTRLKLLDQLRYGPSIDRSISTTL